MTPGASKKSSVTLVPAKNKLFKRHAASIRRPMAFFRTVATSRKNQLRAFKKKFGREPGPNDPVFFDPDADTPQPIPIEKLRATVIEAAKKAGLDPDRVLRTFGFDE